MSGSMGSLSDRPLISLKLKPSMSEVAFSQQWRYGIAVLCVVLALLLTLPLQPLIAALNFPLFWVSVLIALLIGLQNLSLRQRQRQAEADYHSLLNTANEGIWIIDAQGRTNYVNQPLAEMFAYTVQEMLERSIFDFMDEGLWSDAQQYLEGSQQEIKQQFISFRRQDGSVLSCVASTTPRLDQRGTFIGTLLMLTDMTECQQVESSPHNRRVLRDITLAKPAQEELQCLQDDLEQQVQTMDTILSASHDHFYMFDRDGRFIYASRPGLQALGLQKSDIIGKTEGELGFPPEVIEQHKQRREAVFTTGETLTGETSVLTVDGVRQHQYMLIPIPDASGSVQVVVATSRDVTEPRQAQEELRQYRDHLEELVAARTAELSTTIEQLNQEIRQRQRAEAALKESEAYYQSLVDVLPLNLFCKDLEGRIAFANQAFLATVGMSLDECLGKTVYDLYPKQLADQYAADDARLIQRGEVLDIIERHKAPAADEMIDVQVLKAPLRDASGVIIGTQGIFWDITERKRAEEKLHRSEAHLAEAQKIAHIGSWEFDVTTQVITWSDEVSRIFGIDPAQPAPTYSEFIQKFHPDDQEILQNAVDAAIAQGKSYQLDLRILRPDNSLRHIGARGQVNFNSEGQVVCLFGTILDITERKQAEEALRESEERLRQVFAQAPIGIALAAPNGQLKQVNQALCQMLGYAEAELIALNYAEITHPEDLVYELPYIKQCCTGEISSYQLEKRYLKKNGDILFAHLSCGAVRDRQEKVIYGIGMIQDITERKQAEQELQRQIQYRQLLAEIAFRIRESLQIEMILETTVTELQKLLQADRVLFYRVLPNHQGKVVAEAVVPGWPSTLGRELVDHCFEAKYLKQYQQEIHVWPDVEQAGFQPCHLKMLRQFSIRANLIVPILLKDKLWGLLFVHQCSAPRQWNQFEVDLLRQLADQVSIALAQAELLEQATCHSQELARSNGELEQFAYVASHDLQEPLRTLASYAKLVSRRYSGQLDEKGSRFIQYIMEEALRMQALINDLLRYSRVGRQAQNFAPVKCAAVFDIVVRRLEGAIANSGANVTRDDLPTVMADETQLVQLFQNLLSNAIKYRSEEPPVVHVAAQRQEGQWLFWVRDNGIGIDPKYAERIFVIFQRLHTQDEYSGTGIGLAIAAKIVERHGGGVLGGGETREGGKIFFTIPDPGVSPCSVACVREADLHQSQ